MRVGDRTHDASLGYKNEENPPGGHKGRPYSEVVQRKRMTNTEKGFRPAGGQLNPAGKAC